MELGDPDIPEPIVIPDEDPALITLPAEASDIVIRIRPVDRDGRVVVALDGELDLHAARRVEVALSDAVRSRGCRLVQVNLDDVSYIDSIGLGVLVTARRMALSRDVLFLVVNPQPYVRRILHVTGLERAMGLDPT
jgi:anti-anti-sigma factor